MSQPAKSKQVVIFVGASGSGKSLAVDLLLQSNPNAIQFVKHTTRERRTIEADGIDYYFISNEHFKDLQARQEFLHVKQSDFDNYLFGISKSQLLSTLEKTDLVCLTAHTMKEALETRKALATIGLMTTILYVYAPEEIRISNLQRSQQLEKLSYRYYADVSSKLVDFRSSYDGCDCIIVNDSDVDTYAKQVNHFIENLSISHSSGMHVQLQPWQMLVINKDMVQITDTIKTITAPDADRYCAHIKDTLIAEYNVLRSEIHQYHQDRTNYINFTVALTLGFVIFATSKDLDTTYRSAILLLAPFIYCLFSMLYIDKSMRVIRLADYIENTLRPRLQGMFSCELMQWEEYKRKTKLFPRWLPTTIDRMRLWIFVGPAMVSIAAWATLYFASASLLQHSIGLAGCLVILLALILNHFVQESTGARTKSQSGMERS